MYQVLKEGPDFTCSILLGGKKVRALVDTGASVSLVSSKTYRQLGRKERLRPVDLHLSQADSSRMRIEGMTWLPFQLARTRGDMKVYVAPDLCGELILGSDWLRQHKAQIRFDPVSLTLDGEEIPLGEDNCERSPVVAQADIRLPPRTTVSGEDGIMVEGAPNDGLYQIIPTDRYDNNEGEVTVCSSLVKGSGTVPILLTNSANKTMRIK